MLHLRVALLLLLLLCNLPPPGRDGRPALLRHGDLHNPFTHQTGPTLKSTLNQLEMICEVMGMPREKVEKVVKTLKGDKEAVQTAVNQFIESRDGPFKTAFEKPDDGWAESGKSRRPKKARLPPISAGDRWTGAMA